MCMPLVYDKEMLTGEHHWCSSHLNKNIKEIVFNFSFQNSVTCHQCQLFRWLLPEILPSVVYLMFITLPTSSKKKLRTALKTTFYILMWHTTTMFKRIIIVYLNHVLQSTFWVNFNVILSQNLVLHLQLIGSNNGSWNTQRKLGFHCLIFSGIVVVLNNP